MNEAYFYLLGFIIPLGLAFNAFSVIVCSLSAGLRRTTTGHYLMALATADFLFLIGELIRWMNLAVSEASSDYRSVIACVSIQQIVFATLCHL